MRFWNILDIEILGYWDIQIFSIPKGIMIEILTSLILFKGNSPIFFPI